MSCWRSLFFFAIAVYFLCARQINECNPHLALACWTQSKCALKARRKRSARPTSACASLHGRENHACLPRCLPLASGEPVCPSRRRPQRQSACTGREFSHRFSVLLSAAAARYPRCCSSGRIIHPSQKPRCIMTWTVVWTHRNNWASGVPCVIADHGRGREMMRWNDRTHAAAAVGLWPCLVNVMKSFSKKTNVYMEY